MITFLTSSPTGPLDHFYHVEGLDPKNYFVDNLKNYWLNESHCCLIAANPTTHEENDKMCDFFRAVLIKTNLSFNTLNLYDNRYFLSKEKLLSYDVIILASGHVPTQNQYFKEIHFKKNRRFSWDNHWNKCWKYE